MRSSREPGRGTRDANRERRFELRVMRAKCVTIIYPLKSNASVRTRRETDRPSEYANPLSTGAPTFHSP
jgi:hypothetical protein